MYKQKVDGLGNLLQKAWSEKAAAADSEAFCSYVYVGPPLILHLNCLILQVNKTFLLEVLNIFCPLSWTIDWFFSFWLLCALCLYLMYRGSLLCGKHNCKQRGIQYFWILWEKFGSARFCGVGGGMTDSADELIFTSYSEWLLFRKWRRASICPVNFLRLFYPWTI